MGRDTTLSKFESCAASTISEQKRTDEISGYNVQGVTTNCYDPEELQSSSGDTDEEEDLLEDHSRR